MDHRVSDIDTADHYTWGGVCDGWHLLKDPTLSVIRERVPPGAGEAAHFHVRARQFFYVVSGTATMEFEHEAVTFAAGQGLHVPPGTRHRFVNRSDADVVFLVISSPTTAGDRTNLADATPTSSPLEKK
jgi:mannose-6-phosphate isomerase-like protein (cupin superfamily)